MSRSDSVYVEYKNRYNDKYGSGLKRRNTEIYVPIVQNQTFPLNIYNNGYVEMPKNQKLLQESRASAEGMLEDGEPRRGDQAYSTVWTNPNFRGNGTYAQEEHKYAPLFFELPEFTRPGFLHPAPVARKPIPLDIRRQAFI